MALTVGEDLGVGDTFRKTPVGVYVISDQIPRSRLTDFYGAGAYPLDYPNEWDQTVGRTGHGIWLHGVPSDTYNRPPRASDGCVVLANPDIAEVAQYVQVGVTPVIISDRIEWVERASDPVSVLRRGAE